MARVAHSSASRASPAKSAKVGSTAPSVSVQPSARVRAWIVASALGFVGILAAGFNGASFLNYGHDFSSFLMALGFVLALCVYAIGFYVTR